MSKELRICILGNSGSGKSTLAATLGNRLNLPVFHLDRELLYGNFKKYPFAEQRERHNRIIDGNKWIIDGNYRSLLGDRIEKATHVFFIDISRPQALFWALKRAFIKKNSDRKNVPEGAIDKISWQLLSWLIFRFSKNKLVKEIENNSHRNRRIKVAFLKRKSLETMIQQVIRQL